METHARGLRKNVRRGETWFADLLDQNDIKKIKAILSSSFFKTKEDFLEILKFRRLGKMFLGDRNSLFKYFVKKKIISSIEDLRRIDSSGNLEDLLYYRDISENNFKFLLDYGFVENLLDLEYLADSYSFTDIMRAGKTKMLNFLLENGVFETKEIFKEFMQYDDVFWDIEKGNPDVIILLKKLNIIKDNKEIFFLFKNKSAGKLLYVKDINNIEILYKFGVLNNFEDIKELSENTHFLESIITVRADNLRYFTQKPFSFSGEGFRKLLCVPGFAKVLSSADSIEIIEYLLKNQEMNMTLEEIISFFEKEDFCYSVGRGDLINFYFTIRSTGIYCE